MAAYDIVHVENWSSWQSVNIKVLPFWCYWTVKLLLEIAASKSIWVSPHVSSSERFATELSPSANVIQLIHQ